jgi:branched-chain amino acid transport system permease protein
VTAHGSPAHRQPRRFGRGIRYTAFSAILIAIYAIILWRVLVLGGALSPQQGVAPATLGDAILQALTRFDEVTNRYLSQAIQQTVNALSIGAIYALIALGYTMVYGIIELINFAHGDIFMVGAFASIVFLGGIMGQSGQVENVPFLILLLVGALAFTMPLVGLLNVSIERLVYRPLRNAPRLAPLITAIGVSFILQNVALVIAGSGDRSSPQVFPLAWQLNIAGASISVLSIFIFALSLGLMLALQAFVTRTRMGRAMRATAQDREAAALMGVDMNQTIALTFLLGGVLAAAAGVVWGLRFGYVRQDLGLNAGLKAFTSAVLGGIGNINGAVLGGFVIGFIENFASSVGQSRWSQFLVFLVLTLVLIFKPSGLFGQQTGDRA